MKKSVVDYRELRLSNVCTPRFRHVLLLLGWVIYFITYFLTENLIPPGKCFRVHCGLDDRIPFCEWFVIPYVGWYLLIIWSLGYFLLYNVESFKNLQIYFMITQSLAVAAYILFPTRQDLRPAIFPRVNFLTDIVKFLYRVDTNTGVCPSLHCALSLAIGSVWRREKHVRGWVKAFVGILVFLICLSTMFIKQHSALDFLAAVPVCLVAERFLFGRRKTPPD